MVSQYLSRSLTSLDSLTNGRIAPDKELSVLSRSCLKQEPPTSQYAVALFDQPRLFVVRGNGFSHMERAQDLAINTSLSDRVIGDITRLAGVLPAAEAQFGEVFVQSAARCFILGQLGVEGFDVLHRPAGVPDGSSFNLVGN